MEWTETKVDPNSLPNNGAKVEYELDGGIVHQGVYDSEPEMFWTSPDTWAESFQVVRWRYI